MGNGMNDELIRKQDALDAFCLDNRMYLPRNSGRTGTYVKMVMDNIKALSPVYVPVINVGDMISRQAAIDAMLGDKVEITNVIRALGNERDFEVLNCTCDRHAEIIKDLPLVQPETCEGCKHLGKWENEVEYGYPSPCTRCKRRAEDHYER